MSRMTRNVVKPLHATAFGLRVSQPHASYSRTLLKRCLLDTVLPAVALLSMSALTVTMIVLVVTTVAHGGWLEPPTYVSVDPWADLYPGSAVLGEDDLLYPDVVTHPGAEQSDPSLDPQAQSRANAGYFAAETAE